MLRRLDRDEEADKCIETAIEIEPKNAEAWFEKGCMLRSKGKYDEVEKCFAKAKKFDPRYEHAWIF